MAAGKEASKSSVQLLFLFTVKKYCRAWSVTHRFVFPSSYILCVDLSTALEDGFRGRRRSLHGRLVVLDYCTQA